MSKVRYNIMLLPKVVTAIDYQAQRLDVSRSDLIQQILVDYINDNDLLFNRCEEQIDGQLDLF